MSPWVPHQMRPSRRWSVFAVGATKYRRGRRQNMNLSTVALPADQEFAVDPSVTVKDTSPPSTADSKRQKIPHVLGREWRNINHSDRLKVHHISDSRTFEKALRLEHGLERVLFNPGVHILRDSRTGLYNFDPYLRNIVQPQNFNYDMLPAYKRPSQDQRLVELAQLHGKRFVGASSSLVGILSQMYFLISNMKPINTSMLSHTYINQLRTFTRLSRGPFSVLILPKDQGSMYVIDPDHKEDPRFEDQDERILMDLGKSMEAMLVLPEREFSKMVKPDAANDKPSTSAGGAGILGGSSSILPNDVFHYSTIEDFFVRSQLDCHHPALPNKTFDLKTRATLAIRYDIARYREHLHYSLDRRFGLLQSYERELYDMIRAAMLKYNFQVRLGHMDGIFVTYHNTAEIFGFEYVPREDMDMFLFGGPGYGNEAYRLCFKMLNRVFNLIVEHYPTDPVRLLVRVDEERPGRMELFVERLKWNPSNPLEVLHSSGQEIPDVVKYELNTFSAVNGYKVDGFQVPSEQLAQWELYFRIDKDVRDASFAPLEYGQLLSKFVELRKSHPKYVDRIMQRLFKDAPGSPSSTQASDSPAKSATSETEFTGVRGQRSSPSGTSVSASEAYPLATPQDYLADLFGSQTGTSTTTTDEEFSNPTLASTAHILNTATFDIRDDIDPFNTMAAFVNTTALGFVVEIDGITFSSVPVEIGAASTNPAPPTPTPSPVTTNPVQKAAHPPPKTMNHASTTTNPVSASANPPPATKSPTWAAKSATSAAKSAASAATHSASAPKHAASAPAKPAQAAIPEIPEELTSLNLKQLKTLASNLGIVTHAYRSIDSQQALMIKVHARLLELAKNSTNFSL